MKRAAWSLAVLALSGCAATMPTPPSPPALDSAWRTQRAEHRVSLDVTRPDGTHDRRTLRGLVAIARPDRFRLRALGPGGVTLFDVLSVRGEVRVLEAIRDASPGSTLAAVVRSVGGDLQAAFDLTPTPTGRTVTALAEAIVVREPGRTVRLAAFRRIAGHSIPTRIEMKSEALAYQAVVDVSSIELDVPLDEALFRP